MAGTDLVTEAQIDSLVTAVAGAVTNIGHINHGATASTARPSFDMVIWYGSVQPTNAIAPDLVIRTDEAV